MLLVDCREPKSMVELLRKKVEFRIVRLDPGDYVAGSTAIERKTVEDFLRSLASGRLFEQVSRLHYAYPSTYLLVEGLLDWSALKRPGWFCNALQSTVLLGVPVLFSTCQQDTVNLLTRIAMQSSVPAEPRIVLKKHTTRHLQVGVLCSFPCIGEKRAKALLHSFITLRKVFSATRSELCGSVGRKTARAMTALLDTPLEVPAAMRKGRPECVYHSPSKPVYPLHHHHQQV